MVNDLELMELEIKQIGYLNTMAHSNLSNLKSRTFQGILIDKVKNFKSLHRYFRKDFHQSSRTQRKIFKVSNML